MDGFNPCLTQHLTAGDFCIPGNVHFLLDSRQRAGRFGLPGSGERTESRYTRLICCKLSVYCWRASANGPVKTRYRARDKCNDIRPSLSAPNRRVITAQLRLKTPEWGAPPTGLYLGAGAPGPQFSGVCNFRIIIIIIIIERIDYSGISQSCEATLQI